jgi:acyl-CoA reductase-like NAD-dependent aldehyde dehydrogenase
VPFGGCKSSGVGRAGGQPGLDEYAEFKTVIVYKSAYRV